MENNLIQKIHGSNIYLFFFITIIIIITDGELSLGRVKPGETLVEARMRF